MENNMNAATYVKEKLREVFDTTIELGIKYDGEYKSINYYNLFCQAGAKDQLYELMGNNMCMFNYSFKGEDAVMIIFSIAINPNETGAKSIADRVMEVIGNIEECFITIDYTKSEEIKEDKVVYVTTIKKLGEKL
jgi:hypothetical protein